MHTLTEVAHFGGGIAPNPALNEGLDLAEECKEANNILPGGEGACVRARGRHPPVPVLLPSVDARTDQGGAQPLRLSCVSAPTKGSYDEQKESDHDPGSRRGCDRGRRGNGDRQFLEQPRESAGWDLGRDHPAPPLPPITVYQTWNSDGTYLSYSGNGTLGDSPAGRSNEFGSWERIEGRLYASSGSYLPFNTQTGAHIDSTRIDRTIRLSDDGESFAVIGRVRVLDLDGNVISTALVRTSGVRMQIERIADEP